jgi:hypothetical protein
LNPEGQPTGEITNWDEIRFPFDKELQLEGDLAGHTVSRFAAPQGFIVHEDYSCDASGKVSVKISTESTGYGREYSIGQWSSNGSGGNAAKKSGHRSKAS